MENDVQWFSDGRGSAVLILLIISRLLLALGASFKLQLTTALCDAEREFLESLPLEGRLLFNELSEATIDFGRMARLPVPRAVLQPANVQDISALLRALYLGAPMPCNLTVAARGHAHSLHGQAQAPNGVLIDMSSLRGTQVICNENVMYADVRGGELWIDVLEECLKEGLAPKSWTDYLYLTVGGTLSNAGVSGQAFLHGPQISNVHQLEVVTGKGDVVICSEHENSDLFFGTLGGLGQFGIITRARIALEPAPQRVRWVRVLYSDFDTFRKDQEYLISQPHGESFDYLEGFVVPNSETLLDNWRSALFVPQQELRSSVNGSTMAMAKNREDGALLYYLEVTKNYNEEDAKDIDERVASLLAPLHCIPSSVYSTDISYLDFLNRVHAGELRLRAKGLWDIPHPWLNLFIPRSKIVEFDAVVFKRMLAGKKGSGPIIIYPMNRHKWDERTSVALPEEEVFYLVALLRSPSPDGAPAVEELLQQNEAILQFCQSVGMGEKQYLPSLSTTAQWRRQFGDAKWATFVRRKASYDPHALLSPGQNIFHRSSSIFNSSTALLAHHHHHQSSDLNTKNTSPTGGEYISPGGGAVGGRDRT